MRVETRCDAGPNSELPGSSRSPDAALLLRVRYGRDVESEHLPGGSGGVWRVTSPGGPTRVHRPTGPWTPAVHALLGFLNEQGLDGVPRVHGLDDEGREVLDYLPGRTLDPETEIASEAPWLRRRPGFAAFMTSLARLPRFRDGEVICHNDPGLYNWVILCDTFGLSLGPCWGRGIPLMTRRFCWSGVPRAADLPGHSRRGADRLAAEALREGNSGRGFTLTPSPRAWNSSRSAWRAASEREDPGTICASRCGHHGSALLLRVTGVQSARGGSADAAVISPVIQPDDPAAVIHPRPVAALCRFRAARAAFPGFAGDVGRGGAPAARRRRTAGQLAHEQAERVRTAQLRTESQKLAVPAAPWIIVGHCRGGRDYPFHCDCESESSSTSSRTESGAAKPDTTTPGTATKDTSKGASKEAQKKPNDKPAAAQVPKVDVGPTTVLSVTQWGVSGNLSQKFGMTRYTLEMCARDDPPHCPEAEALEPIEQVGDHDQLLAERRLQPLEHEHRNSPPVGIECRRHDGCVDADAFREEVERDAGNADERREREAAAGFAQPPPVRAAEAEPGEMRAVAVPQQERDERDRGEAEGDPQKLVDQVESWPLGEGTIDGCGLRREARVARHPLDNRDNRIHPRRPEGEGEHDRDFPPEARSQAGSRAAFPERGGARAALGSGNRVSHGTSVPLESWARAPAQASREVASTNTAIGSAVCSPQAPTIGEAAPPTANWAAPRSAEADPRASVASDSASALAFDMMRPVPPVSANAHAMNQAGASVCEAASAVNAMPAASASPAPQSSMRVAGTRPASRALRRFARIIAAAPAAKRANRGGVACRARPGQRKVKPRYTTSCPRNRSRRCTRAAGSLGF
ncbi:hypothetical protein FQR65_LT19969 [Abscondita terminalis]|nr:hypothetical protein FQR65_LT19969 [Abscondita terminalis]